ncbi:MAG: hypothetical protein IPI67_39145 [Myxococcales bacterium]|nr:hypothetical protein [Myxococcales bacterium]
MNVSNEPVCPVERSVMTGLLGLSAVVAFVGLAAWAMSRSGFEQVIHAGAPSEQRVIELVTGR